MQLFARMFFSLSICVLAACGNSAQSETPTRSLQAAAMSADDSGASDLHASGTSQKSSTTSRALASREALSASFAFDSNVEFAGCQAHLFGQVAASVGDTNTLQSVLTGTQASLDANIVFLPGTCHGKKRTVSGSETIDAMLTSSGGTISAYQNLTTTFSDGSVMTVASENPNAATYQLSTQPISSDGNLRVSVAVQEARRRVGADGKVVFDLSITSDPNDPLVIDNAYEGTVASASLNARTIVRGTLHTIHRETHVLVDHAFENLVRRVASCSCPSSGSVLETETAADGTIVATSYVFTGCGKAQATIVSSTRPGVVAGQVQAYTLEDCD